MCEACLIEDLSRRRLLHSIAGAGLAAWLAGLFNAAGSAVLSPPCHTCEVK